MLIEFLRVKDVPHSLSWHLVREDQKPNLDTDWHCEQMLRAADEVLSPLGVPKDILAAWFNDHGVYWTPEDYARETPILWPLLEQIFQQSKVKGEIKMVTDLLKNSKSIENTVRS